MPAIRENWTDIRGELRGMTPSPRREGFVELEITVFATNDVEGFPSLIQPAPGEVLTVFAKAQCVAGKSQQEGLRVAIRVRRGSRPDQLFAHTDHVQIGID